MKKVIAIPFSILFSGAGLLAQGVSVDPVKSPLPNQWRGATESPFHRVDQEKLIPNIRKSLSIPLNWEIKIANLEMSPFPNFYRGLVEISLGEHRRLQNIFISTDSRYYLIGNLYDVNTDMDALRMSWIDLKNAPSKGSPNAPVTIVEYIDLQCSACKVAHEFLEKEKLVENYAGKVRMVYKYYIPTKAHQWAEDASIACLCAYQQSQEAFLKMQNSILLQQNEIAKDNLEIKLASAAHSAGLNMKKFKECVQKKATKELLQAQQAEAIGIGVTSTPTFFVNGRAVLGIPDVVQLRKLIDSFLAPATP